MWTLQYTDEYVKRLKKYEKRHRLALYAALNNLDTYHVALNCNVKPQDIKAGFIHPEPSGTLAIDQKGAKGKPRQLRIYIYPCEVEKVLHVITIGDKNTQKADIATCTAFANAVRKSLENGEKA